MRKERILLNSVEKVNYFTSVVGKYEHKIDLANDSCVINARSILGIFSLNLAAPLEMIIHESDEKLDELLDSLTPFLIHS